MKRGSGAFLVLGSGIVFSFGALVFRATDEIGPWPYLAFRGLSAFAVVLPVFWWQHRGRVRQVVREVERIHVVAGLILGMMLMLFIVALDHADTAFVLFFQGLAPIAAAFFGWLILGEPMTGAARYATLLSLIGVTIMVGGGLGAGVGWGIVFAAILPFMVGLFPVLIRTGQAIDPLVPVLIAGLLVGVVSLSVALAGDGMSVSGHDAFWGVVAGAVLVGLPLPFLNIGQRRVLAPEASMLLMSEIVLAPVWVWLVFDERPASATLVGGVIILIAVIGLTVRSLSGVSASR